MGRHFLKFLPLLCAFAVLLPASALAQSPAGKPPRPICIPGINGYPVGVPHRESGPVGVHAFIGCRDPKTKTVIWDGVSCRHGECSEALMAAVIYTVTRASGKVAAANAAWDKYVTVDCRTDPGPMCAERRAILNANAVEWSK